MIKDDVRAILALVLMLALAGAVVFIVRWFDVAVP